MSREQIIQETAALLGGGKATELNLGLLSPARLDFYHQAALQLSRRAEPTPRPTALTDAASHRAHPPGAADILTNPNPRPE